jgi:hypothetical protein
MLVQQQIVGSALSVEIVGEELPDDVRDQHEYDRAYPSEDDSDHAATLLPSSEQ